MYKKISIVLIYTGDLLSFTIEILENYQTTPVLQLCDCGELVPKVELLDYNDEFLFETTCRTTAQQATSHILTINSDTTVDLIKENLYSSVFNDIDILHIITQCFLIIPSFLNIPYSLPPLCDGTI
uniref:Uncharacterized protein n=1 Tax=Hymenopteran phasma-related virus OKIAV230 TaxID=2746314 RepID=A0A7D7J168_9VIRU|nr:hypothetical protein [Hymenopteran phasma-related virus OKIAV230]